MLDNQAVYELAIVYYPITGDEHSVAVKNIKNIIKESSGQIEKEDVWDVQDLAYPIKKQTMGIYAFYQLTFADLSKIKQLDVELNISKHVLRHLLLKLDQKRIDQAKQLAQKIAQRSEKTEDGQDGADSNKVRSMVDRAETTESTETPADKKQEVDRTKPAEAEAKDSETKEVNKSDEALANQKGPKEEVETDQKVNDKEAKEA